MIIPVDFGLTIARWRGVSLVCRISPSLDREVRMQRGDSRHLIWLVLILVLSITGDALPFVNDVGIPAYASKVVSEAADVFVQRVGLNKDALKISSVDMKDAKLGESVIYEFEIEIGDIVVPIIFREEIRGWRFLDDIEAGHEEGGSGAEAVNIWLPNYVPATLKPFELVGPVDLWIQDAGQLRLAMPHDVDAGVLKRVLVADGAIVTVEGAREVSLTRPLKLPLPLVGDAADVGIASRLLNLASRLRMASRSQGKPLLALRIVGPSTLVAVAPEQSDTAAKARLKVKRLSTSAVELVSRNNAVVPLEPQGSPLVLSDPWLWPLASLNGTNPELVALEQAVLAFLGPKAYQQGSVNLLKAKAAVASFVKIPFELERNVTNAAEYPEQWPEWATKPTVERLQFELLAKVERDKVHAISVNQVATVSSPSVTMSWGEMTGNSSIAGVSPFWGPVDPMTLELDWDGMVP